MQQGFLPAEFRYLLGNQRFKVIVPIDVGGSAGDHDDFAVHLVERGQGGLNLADHLRHIAHHHLQRQLVGALFQIKQIRFRPA